MNNKMSRAEVQAYADLAQAARRVQMLEKRRKNARKKPKVTAEDQQRIKCERIKFAKSLDLDTSVHWGDDDCCKPWFEAAREAIRLGLYSPTNYLPDVAGWLRQAKVRP